MRVSRRADYGVRALFDLAERVGRGPTQSREIASRQGIPEPYLHQLLGALNRAGLVRSTRGPAGGHQLARAPSEISVWDVVTALDGGEARDAIPSTDGSAASAVVRETWSELHERSVAYLSDITLASLLDRSRTHSGAVDYVI